MRYDLTMRYTDDFEWSVIEPLLPTDRRGPKPQNNRRVLNGIFWMLRTGAPWRDLPERYGPYTTAYNRFNRWRKAGIWDRLMDAVVKVHDGKVQMIDSSIVRVHQHASGVKKRVRRFLRDRNGAAKDRAIQHAHGPGPEGGCREGSRRRPAFTLVPDRKTAGGLLQGSGLD